MEPRKLALSVLDKQQRDGQYSNIAVDHAREQLGDGGKDERLFSALVYGVIERRITLDYLIDSLSSLPPSKIERTTRNILRMGLYQLIYMDRIPPHAAIDQSVSLGNKRSRGFINALLRNYLRRVESAPLPEAFSFPSREAAPADYLSITYSYPAPLCRRFIDIFGLTKAEAILSAFDRVPPMTLRANTLKTDRAALMADLADAGLCPTPTENSPHGFRVVGASPETVGVTRGLCMVQDEASQLCVEALGARPGETVIDMCACPGSKSFGAALTMENKGRILAFDLHENKLSLITSGAERLGIHIIETAARDGRVFDKSLESSAHRVLCDVPCSGFGVVAKKPEIRYKSPEAAAGLPDIQLAILKNGARYVRPGGVLVYSTCTLLPEENEQNIARFLEANDDFTLCPFTAGALHAPLGHITLTPDIHGTDGFFIAKLIRKETAQ